MISMWMSFSTTCGRARAPCISGALCTAACGAGVPMVTTPAAALQGSGRARPARCADPGQVSTLQLSRGRRHTAAGPPSRAPARPWKEPPSAGSRTRQVERSKPCTARCTAGGSPSAALRRQRRPGERVAAAGRARGGARHAALGRAGGLVHDVAEDGARLRGRHLDVGPARARPSRARARAQH